MDFSQLTNAELDEFLALAKTQLPELPSPVGKTKASLAKEVFEILYTNPDSLYTPAVYDLWQGKRQTKKIPIEALRGQLPPEMIRQLEEAQGPSRPEEYFQTLISQPVLVNDPDKQVRQLPNRLTDTSLALEIEKEGSKKLLEKYVKEGNTRLTEVLLKAGANPNNYLGPVSLVDRVAQNYMSYNMLRILLENGGRVTENTLKLASSPGIEVLLKKYYRQ